MCQSLIARPLCDTNKTQIVRIKKVLRKISRGPHSIVYIYAVPYKSNVVTCGLTTILEGARASKKCGGVMTIWNVLTFKNIKNGTYEN